MEGMMSPFTSVRRTLLSSTVLVALGIASVAFASPASAQGKIPDLASSTFAWLSTGSDWRDPPAGMRGPIRHDPDYAYHGNLDGPGQVTVRLGNWKDPVLKPWAAKVMRDSNEEVFKGIRQVPFAAQ